MFSETHLHLNLGLRWPVKELGFTLNLDSRKYCLKSFNPNRGSQKKLPTLEKPPSVWEIDFFPQILANPLALQGMALQTPS